MLAPRVSKVAWDLPPAASAWQTKPLSKVSSLTLFTKSLHTEPVPADTPRLCRARPLQQKSCNDTIKVKPTASPPVRGRLEARVTTSSPTARENF